MNRRRKVAPLGQLRARYLGASAEAYLTLLRGDTAAAVSRFAAIPDSLCMLGGCSEDRVALARLLVAQGELRRAEALLATVDRYDQGRPLHVIAALEHGRVAERLGNAAAALRSYRFVTEVWRSADPRLIRMVEEARAAIDRLGGAASRR
jgi:hypothetical protein